MIVFLSFAPIEYMGGAEKMIFKLAKFMNLNEKVTIINVHSSIADRYGKLILQRAFTDRMSLKDKENQIPKIKIHYKDLIPFTSGWRQIRQQLINARLVYIKYELLELLILTYFGGFSMYKKTIASLHTPFLYAVPTKLSDRIHMAVYSSRLNIVMLRTMKKIHVLNKRDEKHLTNKCQLTNVIRIPNSLPFINPEKVKPVTEKNKLFILFVGELSTRKGVDTICNVIKSSPEQFEFHFIGDGPLKEAIIALTKTHYCIYHGYVDVDTLHKIYSQSDVLFFPSRAEAFGIVMAEAMGFGLKVINSAEISLALPAFIETSVPTREANAYIAALQKNLQEKKQKKIDRTKIRDYALNNYSKDSVNSLFMKNILEI